MVKPFASGDENIEVLMNDAERHAFQRMGQSGEIWTQRLYVHGVDGKSVFVPNASRGDAPEKVVEDMRIYCMSCGADAVVFVSLGWAVRAKPGRTTDQNLRPSHSPDREEVLVLAGETRQGTCQKVLPVVRDQNGKFKGFGEAFKEEEGTVKDYFPQMLSPDFPDEETRRRARIYLESGGVVKDGSEKRRREQGMGRSM